MAGQSPSLDDLTANISRVSDVAARHMFQSLVEENRLIYGALCQSIAASNAAVAGLASVTSSLNDTRTQLAALIPHVAQLSVHGKASNVLYPMVINASSPNSSTTGDTGLSGGSMDSIPTADGILKCPFCPHRHDSEKVHVQHLVRLLDRFVICTDMSLCIYRMDKIYSTRAGLEQTRAASVTLMSTIHLLTTHRFMLLATSFSPVRISSSATVLIYVHRTEKVLMLCGFSSSKRSWRVSHEVSQLHKPRPSQLLCVMRLCNCDTTKELSLDDRCNVVAHRCLHRPLPPHSVLS